MAALVHSRAAFFHALRAVLGVKGSQRNHSILML